MALLVPLFDVWDAGTGEGSGYFLALVGLRLCLHVLNQFRILRLRLKILGLKILSYLALVGLGLGLQIGFEGGQALHNGSSHGSHDCRVRCSRLARLLCPLSGPEGRAQKST